MADDKNRSSAPLAPLDYPEDFNGQLIRQYVDAVVRNKRLAVGHSNTKILAHGRLGKLRDGILTPNVACTLLFAKDPLILLPL
jgi:ATP-dependent DNA helicase RecG